MMEMIELEEIKQDVRHKGKGKEGCFSASHSEVREEGGRGGGERGIGGDLYRNLG